MKVLNKKITNTKYRPAPAKPSIANAYPSNVMVKLEGENRWRRLMIGRFVFEGKYFIEMKRKKYEVVW